MGPKCMEGSGINKNAVGPCICGLHVHGFNQLQIKKIEKKKHSRELQKAKLEFASHRQLYT